LAWDAPAFNGGSPVTNYVIELSDKADQSGLWNVLSTDSEITDLSFKVTELTELHQYMFRVKATNKIGESKPCSATPAITMKDRTGKVFKMQQFCIGQFAGPQKMMSSFNASKKCIIK